MVLSEGLVHNYAKQNIICIGVMLLVIVKIIPYATILCANVLNIGNLSYRVKQFTAA